MIPLRPRTRKMRGTFRAGRFAKNVRTLRNDKQKRQRVDDLVRTAEVRLEPETRKALKALQDEITNITLPLTELS